MVLTSSVDKYGRFGPATAKYFDNFTSLLLNMTFSLDDALKMAKVVHVLEEKKINAILMALVEKIGKYKESLEDSEVLLKRCILLQSKYYVPLGPGEDKGLILQKLEAYLGFFNCENPVEQNKTVTSEVTKLLVKILSSDKELKLDVINLMERANSDFGLFGGISKIARAGSCETVR